LPGTDCGLGGRVHPQNRLGEAVRDGAALARKKLWS
jgi:hypothetical protein